MKYYALLLAAATLVTGCGKKQPDCPACKTTAVTSYVPNGVWVEVKSRYYEESWLWVNPNTGEACGEIGRAPGEFVWNVFSLSRYSLPKNINLEQAKAEIMKDPVTLSHCVVEKVQ